MKVANFATKRYVNYGAAVAAFPLSLATPNAAPISAIPAVVTASAGSTVSSDSGRWIEQEWAGMQDALRKVIVSLPVREEVDLAWYETDGDAIYPIREMQELNVEIIDDPTADGFRFSFSDFDVWN